MTFTRSDNFSGLPAGEQTTDDKGQIEVANLTALTSGTLTVFATVEGQTVEAEFVVTKAAYTLTADPDTLTLGMDTKVTFTLTRNEDVLANTPVELSGKDVTINSADTTTGSNGTFSARLTATGTSTATRTITATVGTDTVTVDLSVGKATFVLTASGGGGSFDLSQTITLTAALKDATNNDIPLDSATVTWTVESSTVNSAAWNRNTGVYNGLTWGMTPLSLSAAEGDKTTPGGTAPTSAEAYLTDIVGEREVTVKASVEYNGQTYEAAETVKFGEGPLAVFQKPLHNMTWTEAERTCGSYHGETNLPRKEELQAVSGGSGYGAAFAAGWPANRYGNLLYWTGELHGSVSAWVVYLYNGQVGSYAQVVDVLVAVCRRRG